MKGGEMEDAFLQYGIVGVVALLSLTGFRIALSKLEAKYTEMYENEKERADRMERELATLNQLLRVEYMSAMQRSTSVLGDANRAALEVIESLRRSGG